MQTYILLRSTAKPECSASIGAMIGHLLQSNPGFISDFHNTRMSKLKIIIDIFNQAKNNESSELPYTPVNLSPREGLFSSLDDKEGVLLQVQTGTRVVVFGKTQDKLWRFNPFDGENASTFTVFENEQELRQVLNNLMEPKYNLIRVVPENKFQPTVNPKITSKL